MCCFVVRDWCYSSVVWWGSWRLCGMGSIVDRCKSRAGRYIQFGNKLGFLSQWDTILFHGSSVSNVHKCKLPKRKQVIKFVFLLHTILIKVICDISHENLTCMLTFISSCRKFSYIASRPNITIMWMLVKSPSPSLLSFFYSCVFFDMVVQAL